MGFLELLAVGILSLAVGNLNAKSVDKPEAEAILMGPSKSFVCPSNGRFHHEEKCEFFYDCIDGKATLYDCNPGADRLYNAETGYCDNAYMVHCGSRIRPDYVSPVLPSIPEPTTTKATTTTTTTTTTLPPPTTTIKPEDNFKCTSNGAHPHPKYCEKYFDCWNGTATLLSCPNATLFDVEYFGCKTPFETECGDRIRPTPIHFDCPDKEDKYYPDPAYCAGFFRCVDGFSTHYICPDDLVFNPELDVCDYPENVSCASRTSKSPGVYFLAHA